MSSFGDHIGYDSLSTNSNAGKKKESKPKVSTKNKQTVEKTDPQKLAAQRKAYNELTDAIRNYSNISKRIANENPFEGDYEEAVRLENKIEELQNHPLLSQKQIETAQRSIERLGVSIDNITNKLNASRSDAISNISKKIDSFNVNGFSSNDFNYIDSNNIMATSCYIKSKDPQPQFYYWVNENGIWEPEWNTTTPDLKKYMLVE